MIEPIDMNLFNALYEPLVRQRRLEDRVPYRDRAGISRRFGLEMEFSGGSVGQIARALHAAGLSAQPQRIDYRHGHRSAWNYEDDCSCGNELVTPPLDDDPVSWMRISEACRIIREGGGRASTSAGCHVNIDIDGITNEQMRRIVLLIVAFEDVLYRLCSHAGRGTHRTNSYTGSSRSYISDELRAADWRDSYHFRHRIDCAGTMTTRYERGAAEFRLVDATLRPYLIQAQVLLCARIIESGTYLSDDDVLALGVRARGWHYARNTGGRRLVGPDWAAQTYHLRQLLAALRLDDAQLGQLVGLFAATRWQHPMHERGAQPARARKPWAASTVSATAPDNALTYAAPARELVHA